MNITRQAFEVERETEKAERLELSRELIVALRHIQGESAFVRAGLGTLERNHITQKFNELIAVVKLYAEGSENG